MGEEVEFSEEGLDKFGQYPLNCQREEPLIVDFGALISDLKNDSVEHPQKILSNTRAAFRLAPRQARDLLAENQYAGIPESLAPYREYREQADAMAKTIMALTQKKYIPLLARLVGDLDLGHLGRVVKVSDAIEKKLALIALYKIIELAGSGGEKSEAMFPKQVIEYAEAILPVEEIAWRLEEAAELAPVLKRGLNMVVQPHMSWLDQDQAGQVVEQLEQDELSERVLKAYSGLKMALRLSGIWRKEGLPTDKVLVLSKNDAAKMVLFGFRFFAWSIHLNKNIYEQHKVDWREMRKMIFNKEHKKYFGNKLPIGIIENLKKELAAAEEALFEDDLGG